MDVIWNDLRLGFRLLRRNPGFSLVVILILGVGIGANTFIFSAINALLLRPLPVRDPDRVVTVYSGISHTSYPIYRELEKAQFLESLSAFQTSSFNFKHSDRTLKVLGQLATPNYFSVLGVAARMGHTFGPELESEQGSDAVAVISHGFWKHHFALDPGVLGRSISVNGHPIEIIGVMPAGFRGTFPFMLSPEIWMPLSLKTRLQPTPDAFQDPELYFLEMVGRLKPGITAEQARSGLQVLADRLAGEYPKAPALKNAELFALTGIDAFRGMSFAPVVFLFLGVLTLVVSLVLLLACVNIANLFLARSWERQREVAVRQALGAGRLRILSMLLSEGLLLATAAGLLGCLLAGIGVQLLSLWQPSLPVPVEIDFALDWKVLTFALLISFSTVILFGLFPALQTARVNVVGALKEGLQGSSGPASSRIRKVLVVAQVSISLLLLIAAGLFLRSLLASHSVDPGFDLRNVVTAELDLEAAGYDEVRGRIFLAEVRDRIGNIPGVQSTSLARLVPMTFSRTEFNIGLDSDLTTPYHVLSNTVGSDYFHTMGIALRQGREFSPVDTPESAPVAIVNETLARILWPGGKPLGSEVWLPLPGSTARRLQIVGVVADSKYYSFGEPPAPVFYLPVSQNFRPQLTLHVRVADDAERYKSVIQDAVCDLDPALVVETATLEENVELAFLPATVAVVTLGSFGLVGLILASIGIFGLMRYLTLSRTREIGIRLALGASRKDILPLIVRDGLQLALWGIGTGIVLALGVTRIFQSLLVQVEPTDPATYLVLSLLLLLVAAAACYLPARRSSRIDPIRALRQD